MAQQPPPQQVQELIANAAAQDNHTGHSPATPTAQHRYDDKYSPPFFYGLSSEDAVEYVSYLERYAAYKHLTDAETLELPPVLPRDATSDFYDSLTEVQKQTWQDFKEAFLERFGCSAAQRWNDMKMLWSQSARPKVICQSTDFVAHLTRLAKRLPTLDDGMLKYAVIRGFKPHIRTHVLQANVQTMTELLQAARIAEMAATANETTVSAAINELRATNHQHVAAFEQLSARLDKLAVSPVNNQANIDDRPRRSALPHVHFTDDRPRCSPSPAPRRHQYDIIRHPPPQNNYRRQQTTYQQTPAQRFNSTCYRCGRHHQFRQCPAVNATCLKCNKVGHFQSVCQAGRRSGSRPPI